MKGVRHEKQNPLWTQSQDKTGYPRHCASLTDTSQDQLITTNSRSPCHDFGPRPPSHWPVKRKVSMRFLFSPAR